MYYYIQKIIKFISNLSILEFILWRFIWCSIITIKACFNILNIYNNIHNSNVILNTYYHKGTLIDMLTLLICLLLDSLIIIVKPKLANISFKIHHVIALTLNIIAIYVSIYTNITHHYVINMFITTEIVNIALIFLYLKKRDDELIYGTLYIILYGLLTIFCRGYVWITLLIKSLSSNNTHLMCKLGTLPLLILDIIWVYECMMILYNVNIRKLKKSINSVLKINNDK